MRSNLYIILSLTLISGLAGGLLSWWDVYTNPIISANKEKEFNAALTEVLPSYDSIKEIGKTSGGRYLLATKANIPVGYAVLTIANGFQSELRLLYSLNPSKNKIIKLKILDQLETPGLGTKISADKSNKENPEWFASQFSGVTVLPKIEYIKNKKPEKENQVEAITGATISSRAVVNGLNKSVKVNSWPQN